MSHTTYGDFIQLLHRYEGASVFPAEADRLHAAADALIFGDVDASETLASAAAALKTIAESGRLSVETVARLEQALGAIRPVEQLRPALAA